MGHELLNAAGSRSVKRAHKKEILSAIVNVCAQAADMQKENFAAICGKYGRNHVLRVCCDLVVVSDGSDIPLAIWDYATAKSSQYPAIDAALAALISQKEITRLFRNCIVREERIDGKTIVHRRK